MRNSNGRNAFSMTISFLVVGGLTFLMNSMPASADENVSLHGKTIAELSAGWWEWQEENYPGFNFGDGIVDCSLGQKGPVWYLGGTGGGSDQRTCHAPIKGHKHLMFPLVNVAMFNPVTGKADRIGFKTLDDGRKVRVFKSNGEVVDV